MHPTLQHSLDTLFGRIDSTRKQAHLDDVARIVIDTYTKGPLSLDRQYVAQHYGREFAQAISELGELPLNGKRIIYMPLEGAPVVRAYLAAHPGAEKSEKHLLLRTLMQALDKGSYHIAYPVAKSEAVLDALSDVNRKHQFLPRVTLECESPDEDDYYLRMTPHQYQLLSSAWLAPTPDRSAWQRPTHTTAQDEPIYNFRDFNAPPRSPSRNERPNPNAVSEAREATIIDLAARRAARAKP